MAAIAVLFGGILGFFSGVIALVLGSGVIAALGIWVLSGLAAAALVGTLGLLPQASKAPARA